MCLRLRPNRSIPGSGLLNLKERTHPSSSGRRRCPLEGVPLAELGRGHQELSSAGQRQGTRLIGQYHLTLFSRSIYLQAVALLQPSNILPRVCIQLLCATATEQKEARPGLFQHMPALVRRLWAVTGAMGKQTLKAA